MILKMVNGSAVREMSGKRMVIVKRKRKMMVMVVKDMQHGVVMMMVLMMVMVIVMAMVMVVVVAASEAGGSGVKEITLKLNCIAPSAIYTSHLSMAPTKKHMLCFMQAKSKPESTKKNIL